MEVPILKQGNILTATIQTALTDQDLKNFQNDLADRVGKYRSHGVVVDVSALDVVDSYATRTLCTIAESTKLRGAETIVVGISPDVAFAMVQMGLTLKGVKTALDLEEGLILLNRQFRGKIRRGR